MLRAGVEIDVDCEPGIVRADRLRFRQVLRNLLSNARKYGGPQLRVEGHALEGKFVCTIADNGDGIPQELEHRLFQRYIHRGHQPLVLGSVGLGLSIVHALSEGMGGVVRYERADGWTRFVVTLPLVALARTDEPADVEADDDLFETALLGGGPDRGVDFSGFDGGFDVGADVALDDAGSAAP
jgi:signal transduction histidine kinase